MSSNAVVESAADELLRVNAGFAQLLTEEWVSIAGRIPPNSEAREAVRSAFERASLLVAMAREELRGAMSSPKTGLH